MQIWKRLVSYALPYRGAYLLAALLSVVSVAGELVTPWLFGLAVDRGVAGRDLDTVVLYAAALVGVQAVRSTLGYLQWMVQHRAGQSVVRDLRNELYTALQRLPQRYFREVPTGQIMARMTSDVKAVQAYLGWGLLIQFAAVVSFVATALVLLRIDRVLTLQLLLPLLPLAAVVFYFNRAIAPAWERIREQMGTLTTVLQENVSGVRVVRAFGREREESGKFARENREQRELNVRRARIEGSSFPTMDLMIGLTFVILAWVGARRVIADQMTLGTFFAYQWYLWGIIWPVRFGGWIISMMREALSAAPRLFEVLDAPVGIIDRPEAIDLGEVEGEIRLEAVTFAFDDEPERPVLREVDLVVRPGEVVAVLGATGSGKSSLLNLLPRFQEVSAGRVLVDGRDIRDVTLESLRRQIAVVPQEAFLFSATIRENLAYGRPDAPLDEIEQAARLAQAHDFILALDGGYDARVGERGIGLSGGQKQRLALARAILMNPRILLMDEATSAVDTETEHEIQQAIEHVMAGRTSLIIAQRLSTIKHADRIVVLHDGQIVEDGRHEHLLAAGGRYATLYDQQFRAADVEERALLMELGLEPAAGS